MQDTLHLERRIFKPRLRWLLVLRALVVIACFGLIASMLWGSVRATTFTRIAVLLGTGLVCQLAVWAIDNLRQQCRDSAANQLRSRLLAASAEERVVSTRPFALYLRPFVADGNLGIRRWNSGELFDPFYLWNGFSTDVENTLAELAEHRGLLMIGFGGSGGALGSGRVTESDDDWFASFRILAQSASRIFIVPSASEGLRLEVQYLKAKGLLGRCIFIRPPEDLVEGRINMADMWSASTLVFRDMGISLPNDCGPGGAVVVLDAGGHLVAHESLPKWTMLYISRAIVKVQGRDTHWFIAPFWVLVLLLPLQLAILLVVTVARAVWINKGDESKANR